METHISQPRRLLYSRVQTREVLGGISNTSLQGLEKQGVLTPVRLTGKALGNVFYRAEQVHALAEGATPTPVELPKPRKRVRVKEREIVC